MLTHETPPTEERPWPDITVVLEPGDSERGLGPEQYLVPQTVHRQAARIFQVRQDGLRVIKSRRTNVIDTVPWADVEEALSIKALMDKNGWDRERLAAVIAGFARGERLS